MHFRAITSLLCGVVLLLLSGCGTPSRSLNAHPLLASMTPQFIPAPSGMQVISAAWWPQMDRIVVGVAARDYDIAGYDLYTARPDGADLQRLSLPDDPDCDITARAQPRILHDGRLAFLEECVGVRSRSLEDKMQFMVYDPKTKKTSHLLPYYPPSGSGAYDFAPDLHVGIVQDVKCYFSNRAGQSVEVAEMTVP